MEIVLTSGYILFGIYIVTLVYITIFCLLQLHLLYNTSKETENQTFRTIRKKMFIQW
jgi:uncharacterized membrane protein YwaF